MADQPPSSERAAALARWFIEKPAANVVNDHDKQAYRDAAKTYALISIAESLEQIVRLLTPVEVKVEKR